jgi:hypothetical protein
MRHLPTAMAIILITGLAACGLSEKMEKHNKAKENADFIMANLNSPTIIEHFPEKYFPREQTRPFLDTLTKRCDFTSKLGRYVDFFSMNINGKNQTAYIYEYILNCDSLRFIYIYDLEQKDPELFNFRIEGLEQENKMIIDPKKQILYTGER